MVHDWQRYATDTDRHGEFREDAHGEGADALRRIGQNHRGKTGKLGVGNCTSDFATCIHGCPATQKDIYDGLRRYILGE